MELAFQLIILKISLSGVATNTLPTCDSLALFITCTIIGKPLILTKGLFGNLFALKRVGIIIAVFFINNKIMRLTVAK